VRRVEVAVEGCAFRVLNAVVRPQHLIAIRQRDRLKRRFAGMGTGERLVTGRVPVLSQDDMRESRDKPVDQRHDLVAARHCQRPTRAEIVLNIDDQEKVSVVGLHVTGHRRPALLAVTEQGEYRYSVVPLNPDASDAFRKPAAATSRLSRARELSSRRPPRHHR